MTINDESSSARRRTARRLLASVGACAAIGLAAALAPAGTASAAGGCLDRHFCAFEHAGYVGKLLDSTAPRGSRFIDVANDRVTSGSNRSYNQWVGVNERTGLPDQQIFKFGPRTDVSNVGPTANDKIDHFDVY
jgi:Peptidase inhibitor family I36